MNKIFKMHPGFTMAELLISLLTVSLIATALVPIIGPKKITNPDPKYLHGIAECYWQGGNLMYFYADNKTNKQGTRRRVNGHCTFEPPKTSHIEVFAVGAGSYGSGTDGNGLWLFVDDYTPRYEGNVGIETFRNDIGDNVTAITRDLKVDNQDLKDIVKESFTRWAAAINHNLPMEDNGSWNVDDYPYQNSGKYLYAEFRGVRGPIGKAGNGFSEAKIVPGQVPYSYDTCEMRCTNFTNPKCSLQPKPVGWWRGSIEGDDDTAIATATANGNCYYYLNYIGGNSAEPISVANNDTPILFPLDGTSIFNIQPGNPMRDNGNNTNYNPESGPSVLGIGISARGALASNSLRLGSSAPGKNATSSSDGQSLSNNIPGGNYATCQIMPPNNSNKPKYGVSGTNLTCSNFEKKDSVNPNNVRNGMQHGLLYGAGGILEPEQKGMQGNLGITRPNNAFTWRYVEPRARMRYGQAGTPGEMKTLSFARLTSPLYLFPGRNDGEGNRTNTVVSSNAEGSRVLMEAASPEDVSDTFIDDNYPITETDNAATPPKRILDIATPRNDQFAGYINKMQALGVYGIQGGLFGCTFGGSCPGYGGAGAYPIVVNHTYQNKLHITNNQPYADTSEYSRYKTYSRTFSTNQTNDPVCADRYTDPNAGNQNEGVMHYCTSENDMRRDGAVIIIW